MMTRFFCFLLFIVLSAAQQRVVTLILPLQNIGYNDTITYTATVEPSPIGAGKQNKVTFFDNGVALTPQVELVLINGVATAQYTTQLKGPNPGNTNEIVHTIQAKYKTVASNEVILKVFQGRTEGTLSTDKILYEIGDQVVITATLKRGKGSLKFEPPPNNVKFFNNGNPINVCVPNGTGLVVVPDTNPDLKTFTCTFTIGAAALIGEHELKVVYSGNPPNEFGGVILTTRVLFDCKAPKADCDGDLICEADLSNSGTHCGKCGNACNTLFPNANTACQSSVCTQLTCQGTFSDCKPGIGANAGCETNTNTDKNNCGSCGQDCSKVFINADGNCNSGTCGFGNCDTNFGNCEVEDGPFDGCETNLQTSDQHCGSCGHDCSNQVSFEGHCQSGGCVVDTCKPGFFDCDNTDSNGCEVSCNAPTLSTNAAVNDFNENSNCVAKLPDFKQRTIPRAGSGNSNGQFVKNVRDGIEIALRLERRQSPTSQVVNGKVYRTSPCYQTNPPTSPANSRAFWNYAWSVDFRGGTGAHAGTTVGDWDISVKWETLFNSNPTLFATPLVLNARDFAKGLIASDICTSCSGQVTSPFQFDDGESVTFSNCADLAEKVVDSLTFFQESTNLMFTGQLGPSFNPTTAAGLYQVTLSLTPKASSPSCGLCPLDVSMTVMIDPLAVCN